MDDDADVIDLDRYRAERVAEGSWPPAGGLIAVREYWAARRRKGVVPTYYKPKGGGAA